MKKLRVVIFICVIFSLLSISSIAANVNDNFVFTRSWWDSVLANSVIKTGDSINLLNVVNSKYNNDVRFADEKGTYTNILFARQYQNNKDILYFDISMPFNVSFEKGSSFQYSFIYLIDKQGSSFDSFADSLSIYRVILSDGSSTISADSSVKYIDSSELFIPANTSTNPTSSPIERDSAYFIISVSANFEEDFNVDSLRMTFRLTNQSNANISSRSTYFGVFFPMGEIIDGVIDVPSDELKKLEEIGNTLNNIDINLNDSLTKLEDIKAYLDELLSALSNSEGSTNNYYNTIINQSPEDAQKIEQLKQELNETKNQLEDIVTQLEQTQDTAPSQDYIDDTSDFIIDGINDGTSDQNFINMFDSLFSFELLHFLLIFVFGLATVSYIFFGKR